MEICKIQAAVLRKKGGPLKIESLEMEGPRDDEVLVRIVASGICHTDIALCEGWDEGDPPVVLGHEGSGIVEKVGKNVQNIKAGDHVVLSYQSCGSCHQCRTGRPAHCKYLWKLNFGFQRLDGSNALLRSGVRGHFFGQSSFATYSLATERNLVKVSKDLPLEILAPLGCSMQTGAGTVMNSLRVSKGKSLAVFGTGAVGLAAVMAACLVGANPIIGVDIKLNRLKLALHLGATHIINNRGQDIIAQVAKITGRGVDYIVDTTGSPKMHQLAIEALNPRGVVALLTGEKGTFLPGRKRTLGIIQGDAIPQQFIPKLIDLYLKGKFPFDHLIKFYDFKKINQAIADSKRGATIKPVLRINQSINRKFY